MNLFFTQLAFTLFLSQLVNAQKKEEVNFSDPIQVDSSEYFIIPQLIDNDERGEFGKGKGYFPWGAYRDVYFYDSKSNLTKKVFGNQLALVSAFNNPRRGYYYGKDEQEEPNNILPHQVVYLARTENFNGDNALDSDDPVYFYLTNKTGEGLKQITPAGFSVISWTISKDKKMILVKLKNDKNRNKKFGEGDDDLYYRIDLDEDLSKVKCYQVNM